MDGTVSAMKPLPWWKPKQSRGTSITLVDKNAKTDTEFGVTVDSASADSFTHAEDICIKYIQPMAKKLMQHYEDYNNRHLDVSESKDSFRESAFLPGFVSELTRFCNDAAALGGGYVPPPQPDN